ncbi:MAG: DUF697 domain-containing protein [Planctomycetota bacterium]|nr:DUF697 domain-containing protein [Planctomycetota bacterium]
MNDPLKPQQGDGWLGVRPKPEQALAEPTHTTETTAPDQAHSLGVPRPNLALTKLDEPTAKTRWAESEANEQDSDLADQLVADLETGETGLARWIKPMDAIGWTLVVIFGCITALIVLAQGLAVLDMASRLPQAMAYPLIGLVLILSTMVALAIARLVIGYTRLRRSPRHSLQALAELRFRAQIRGESALKLAAARTDLERFLRQFPLDKAQETSWTKLGIDGKELARKLRQARAELIDRSRHGTDLDWIRALDRQFLGPLDSEADRLIWKHVKQVGVRTAVVPLAFWDDVVLLLALTRMTRGLCLLYNVRTSAAGTAALMGWSMAALAVATEMEHMHTTIQTQIHELLCNHLGHAAAKVVDAVAPSVAAGTANGFFTYRVGRAAIKHLRPVESSKMKA